MHELNAHRTGLVLGSLLGLLHALWAILVWLGGAGPLLNWVLSLHFIFEPISITKFNLGTAVILVIVTSVLGYIVGSVFAALWNAVKK